MPGSPAPHTAAAGGPAASSQYIGRRSPAFRRAVAALFASGFSTFALLYYVQPLMPVFAKAFGVSPAASSLSLSATTALLALAMLVASTLSDTFGRRALMVASLLSSAALTLASVLFPQWSVLVAARALMGITLSGLPAVAMAYVGEEIEPRSSGLAMGLYIGGSALGGMGGRLLAGLIADVADWHAATLAIGALGFVGAALFWRLLPPPRNFRPRPLQLRLALRGFGGNLSDPVLRRLFAQAFLLMGAFVAVYNYIGYRLLAPPFGMSQAVVGLVSAVYLGGIFSSAWMGNLGARLGHHRVMWAGVALELAGLAMTLSDSLAMVVGGLAVLTFGFFGAHSICSAWVARRAGSGRAQASALYLFCYYAGSSAVGYAGGIALSLGQWPGLAALLGVLLAAGLANALFLARRASAPAR
ncbi:MFS transporter [Pigmentiphaga soli]|uniref:MFS transporter n=1 Tax=Pigmentiphaga soli TaxID=1007095 RepID=A0ABP8HCE8_9BURK